MARPAVEIAIVVYPGMTALDVIGPYEVLRMLPGARIRFVWKHVGPVVADSGVLAVGATHTFKEVSRPDVVLVGGSGPATAQAAADPDLLAWLQRVDRTTTWTTSVCSGSVILGAAGILHGHRATSHWAALHLLPGLGAEPVDERVVQSGKVITGAGVSAGIDLALMLVGKIAGADEARAVQLLIEYDPQPPYDSGSLAKAGRAAKRQAAAVVGREATAMARNEPVLATRRAAAHAQLEWQAAIGRVRRRKS